MNITDFLAIGVVAAAMSVLIEYVKKRFKTRPLATKAITVLLAVAVGTGYVWLASTPWLGTVVTILTASTTVWAFFIKKA